MAEQKFDIPKTCKAAVVKNEGPDFTVEVEEVPVPEIGALSDSLETLHHCIFVSIC